MDKEKRTKAKVADLIKIYEGLPEEKLKVASDLIEQAAFMAVTLEDLADLISAEGVTEEYTNGKNQTGRKISSNAKMYSALIGKYASITKQLLQLVPEGKPISANKQRERDRDYREALERARKAESEKRDQVERMDLFFRAVAAGIIEQNDYRDFMAHKIELEWD